MSDPPRPSGSNGPSGSTTSSDQQSSTSAGAADGQNGSQGESSTPRVPWSGPVPSFFVMGPGGSLTPHFHIHHPAPVLPGLPHIHISPSPPASPHGSSQAGRHRSPGPTAAGMPRYHPAYHPLMLPLFMPMAMRRERQPNPEAAKEMIRSLPDVSSKTFRRVDRIRRAEQVETGEDGDEGEDDLGWKCGVCLDGVEAGEANSAKEDIGIKVLPCNHLFHRDCLEPWFKTNLTCPACRLDLDPLNTLADSNHPPTGRPQAPGAIRDFFQRRHTPAATWDGPSPSTGPASGGSSSSNPAPGPAPAPATAAPAAPAPAPAPSGPPLPPPVIFGGGQDFTFIFRMPIPGRPPVDEPHPPPAARPQAPPADPAAPVEPRASATPTLRYHSDLTASPVPMERETPQAPHPLPGLFANILAPPPAEPGSSNPGEGEIPDFFGHLRSAASGHEGHVRAPGDSTPYPPNSPEPAAAETTEDANAADSRPDNRDPTEVDRSETDAPRPAPAAPSDQADQQSAEPPATERPAQQPEQGPEIHFFFNFNHEPPQPQPPAESTPASERPPAPEKDRISLDEWCTNREKALGWRCDAIECEYWNAEDERIADAPTSSRDGVNDEMLRLKSRYGNPLAGTDELCEHRWHRACLEGIERVAGNALVPDEEGKVWARCDRCRRIGWTGRRPEAESRDERGQEGPSGSAEKGDEEETEVHMMLVDTL